jgi:hypothetical protein
MKRPLFLLLSFCAVIPVLAQDRLDTLKRDDLAVAVLASALKPYEQAANLVVTGEMASSPGGTMRIVHKVLDADNTRTEVQMDDKTVVSANSDGQGFASVNGGSKSVVPRWISKFQRNDLFPLLSIGRDLTRNEVSIEYLGEEDLRGRRVHHIRIWSQSFADLDGASVQRLSEFHLYLDKQTLLVAKTARNIFSPETYTNYAQLETLYDRYELGAGIPVPHKIEHFVSGPKVDEITIQDVQQTALNAADFK